MSFQDWQTDEDGNLETFPLTGFTTALFHQAMTGGIRLEYALEPSLENNAAVQLVLTPLQVIELMNALRVMAEKMMAQIEADRQGSNKN